MSTHNDDYYALWRAAPDGFGLLDGQGRFVDINEAYAALLGYPRAELLGRRLAEVEAPETLGGAAGSLAELRASGAGRFETRQRARDGQLVDLEVSAQYDAARDRWVLLVRDITARRWAAELLQQRTQQLGERTVELGERLKELRCLLELSNLTATPDLPLSEVLPRALDLLPPAWQYPALTAAELTLPGVRYATANFRLTPWRLTCPLEAGDPAAGQLTLVYLEARPASSYEGPFLPEERLLLEAVAQRLSGIIQRRRAEEALRLREMSLNSLLDLSQRAPDLPESDIIQLALEEAERLTLSQIAYLHFVNPDQDSIQLYTWSRQTLAQCQAAYAAHYPLAAAGVWADCARQKRPVMHNDYQNHPAKKGYPPGHAHLVRHLSVPVVENDRVKLILGVGNKPAAYDAADVRQLQLTAEHLWRIVQRKRAEEAARREAERVATLARVAARLNAQLDLPAVLQTVCAETAGALGFSAASVSLLAGDTRTLEPVAAWTEAALPGAALPPEALTWLAEAPEDADVVVRPPGPAQPWAGALAAARLTHAGQALGVLAAYTAAASFAWAEEETALLRGLAHQAAQAIVNARLFAEVSLSRERLQALSRRLVEVQEAERRHIARELHDEVGQVLTAVKINLQTLRRQPALAPSVPRLDETIDTVQRALEQVRNLSLDLRPSILDDLGLGAALEWYAQRLTQAAGLELHLALPEAAPRWSPVIEITCFRVAQEALTNILRHAGARQVWIELQPSARELRVRVRDDGQGFDPAAARQRAARFGASVGLLSMAERVALAGGQLEIESAPGQGASVTVRFVAPALR
ncbi:MAG: GAF domain-containing protein [Anaerolineales bacterium]|nr:GAF domain-containing protein [Anaerolineales bacterium]